MLNENPNSNRNYRDRLFKAIYGRDTPQSKKWRLELYNALNGSSYTNPDDIELTTIENVIYITMKNDVSFLLDCQMNLYEQQSTYNPNMPLRGLMYFSQLYQMHLNRQGKDLFGTTLVKIPEPRFIVFYNGSRDFPDVLKLRLSDAFERHADKNENGKPRAAGKSGMSEKSDPAGKTETPEFEWTATMLNINLGHNQNLHKKCKSMYDYSTYVDNVKSNMKTMNREEAISRALDSAISENLLDGFFKTQKMEVLNMSLTEFDQEEYDRNRREEGRIEGAEEKAIETAINLLKLNVCTLEQIAQATGLPLEKVQELQKSIEN